MHRWVVKGAIVSSLVLVLGASGCATSGDVSAARSEAQEALRVANEANAKATQAAADAAAARAAADGVYDIGPPDSVHLHYRYRSAPKRRSPMRRLSLLLPLALLAALPARAGDDRPSRTFVFVYEAGIESVPEGAKQVRLWIPVPADNHDQRIGTVKVRLVTLGPKLSVPALAA